MTERASAMEKAYAESGYPAALRPWADSYTKSSHAVGRNLRASR